MKNLGGLLVMSTFFLFATPAFSQDSSYETFWRGKIKKIFKQFNVYNGTKNCSVQTIKGKTYLIKHLNASRGGDDLCISCRN